MTGILIGKVAIRFVKLVKIIIPNRRPHGYYINNSAGDCPCRFPTFPHQMRGEREYASYITQADKDRMKPELRHKMYQDVSAKNALINKYLKKIAEKAEIAKPLSMHISRHSFAHIAHESGAESSAIKNIPGHSNLATTERYMGSFDTSKTDETLRNVFAKKKTPIASDDSQKSKEEQAIELLKGLTP